MAIIGDFSQIRYEDSVLAIQLTPATNISQWNLRWTLQHRFGGISGLITKSAASGFGGGVSGITITSSGEGRFNVAINGADTSGLDYGAYAYTTERLDSGNRSILAEGYLNLLPGGMA